VIDDERDASSLSFTPADAPWRIVHRGDLFAPVLTMRQRLPQL
jgi:hypothetical protein